MIKQDKLGGVQLESEASFQLCIVTIVFITLIMKNKMFSDAHISALLFIPLFGGYHFFF